jgi:hypothetical protein
MTKHDDKIRDLLARVEEQQAGLGTKPKAAWQTNAIFKYKDGSFFNLNTVKDPQPLVEALATLLERETLLQEAGKRLGVPVQSVMWDGYSVTEWEQDFQKRIQIIRWEERKAQLDATKKKLNSLVSEEAKTELELATIEHLLG